MARGLDEAISRTFDLDFINQRLGAPISVQDNWFLSFI